jgi:hypothetical protein
MDMDLQHGHGQTHRPGHAPLTRTCCIDMEMQYGHGYAVWTWTCTKVMQNGHAAVQRRHRHEVKRMKRMFHLLDLL